MNKTTARMIEAVHEALVDSVRNNLTPDLLKPQFRDTDFPTGHCYVASEAIYHLLGPDSGFYPVRLRMPDGVVHWWLANSDGDVLDPTHDQFSHPVPYNQGKPGGFLTKEPSKRAQEVIRRVKEDTMADSLPSPNARLAGNENLVLVKVPARGQFLNWQGGLSLYGEWMVEDGTQVYNVMDQGDPDGEAYSYNGIVGSITFVKQSDQVYVEELYVVPHYRNSNAFMLLTQPIVESGKPINADFQNPKLQSLFMKLVERGKIQTVPGFKENAPTEMMRPWTPTTQLSGYEQQRESGIQPIEVMTGTPWEYDEYRHQIDHDKPRFAFVFLDNTLFCGLRHRSIQKELRREGFTDLDGAIYGWVDVAQNGTYEPEYFTNYGEANDPAPAQAFFAQHPPEQVLNYLRSGVIAKVADDFSAPMENPVSYQFVPLAPQELLAWNDLNSKMKQWWRRKASKLNMYARNRGTVQGQELYTLSNRYHGNCAYCGQPGATSWDHVIPLSKGGQNAIDNLLPCHIDCNREMDQWDRQLGSVKTGMNLEWVDGGGEFWSAERLPWIYQIDTDTLWYSDWGAYHRPILRALKAGVEHAGNLNSDNLVGGYTLIDGSWELTESFTELPNEVWNDISEFSTNEAEYYKQFLRDTEQDDGGQEYDMFGVPITQTSSAVQDELVPLRRHPELPDQIAFIYNPEQDVMVGAYEGGHGDLIKYLKYNYPGFMKDWKNNIHGYTMTRDGERLLSSYERGTLTDMEFPGLSDRAWALYDKAVGVTSGWKLAMPYHNNTWYHAADASQLQSIMDYGLQPRSWIGVGNFSLPAAEDAVYMWPTAALAYQYATHRPPSYQGPTGKPIVLRIRNVDLNMLAPDHEAFSHWLSDQHSEQDYNPLYEEVIRQSWIYNEIYNDPNDNDTTYDHAIEILQQLTPELRTQIAEQLSSQTGEAVMLYSPVPENLIDVAKVQILNEDAMDEWWPEAEEWYDQQPTNYDDPEHDDQHEKWNEEMWQAWNDWLEAHDGEWIALEDLEAFMEDHENVTDNSDEFAQKMKFTPLQQPVTTKWETIPDGYAPDCPECSNPLYPRFKETSGFVGACWHCDVDYGLPLAKDRTSGVKPNTDDESAWVYDPETDTLYTGPWHREIFRLNPEISEKMKPTDRDVFDMEFFKTPLVLGWANDPDSIADTIKPTVFSDYGDSSATLEQEQRALELANQHYIDKTAAYPIPPPPIVPIPDEPTPPIPPEEEVEKTATDWRIGDAWIYDPITDSLHIGGNHFEVLRDIGVSAKDVSKHRHPVVFGWWKTDDAETKAWAVPASDYYDSDVTDEQIARGTQLADEQAQSVLDKYQRGYKDFEDYYTSKTAAVEYVETPSDGYGGNNGEGMYTVIYDPKNFTLYVNTTEGSSHRNLQRVVEHQLGRKLKSSDHSMGYGWVVTSPSQYIDATNGKWDQMREYAQIPDDLMEAAYQHIKNMPALYQFDEDGNYLKHDDPRFIHRENTSAVGDLQWMAGWVYDPSDDRLYTGTSHRYIMTKNNLRDKIDSLVFGWIEDDHPIVNSWEFGRADDNTPEAQRGLQLAQQWWDEYGHNDGPDAQDLPSPLNSTSTAKVVNTLTILRDRYAHPAPIHTPKPYDTPSIPLPLVRTGVQLDSRLTRANACGMALSAIHGAWLGGTTQHEYAATTDAVRSQAVLNDWLLNSYSGENTARLHPHQTCPSRVPPAHTTTPIFKSQNFSNLHNEPLNLAFPNSPTAGQMDTHSHESLSTVVPPDLLGVQSSPIFKKEPIKVNQVLPGDISSEFIWAWVPEWRTILIGPYNARHGPLLKAVNLNLRETLLNGGATGSVIEGQVVRYDQGSTIPQEVYDTLAGMTQKRASSAPTVQYVPEGGLKIDSDRTPVVYDPDLNVLYIGDAGGTHPYLFKKAVGEHMHMSEMALKKQEVYDVLSAGIYAPEGKPAPYGIAVPGYMQWFHGPLKDNPDIFVDAAIKDFCENQYPAYAHIAAEYVTVRPLTDKEMQGNGNQGENGQAWLYDRENKIVYLAPDGWTHRSLAEALHRSLGIQPTDMWDYFTGAINDPHFRDGFWGKDWDRDSTDKAEVEEALRPYVHDPKQWDTNELPYQFEDSSNPPFTSALAQPNAQWIGQPSKNAIWVWHIPTNKLYFAPMFQTYHRTIMRELEPETKIRDSKDLFILGELDYVGGVPEVSDRQGFSNTFPKFVEEAVKQAYLGTTQDDPAVQAPDAPGIDMTSAYFEFVPESEAESRWGGLPFVITHEGQLYVSDDPEQWHKQLMKMVGGSMRDIDVAGIIFPNHTFTTLYWESGGDIDEIQDALMELPDSVFDEGYGLEHYSAKPNIMDWSGSWFYFPDTDELLSTEPGDSMRDHRWLSNQGDTKSRLFEEPFVAGWYTEPREDGQGYGIIPWGSDRFGPNVDPQAEGSVLPRVWELAHKKFPSMHFQQPA